MVVLSAKRKIFPNRVTKFWLALATQKEINKVWTEFDMACLRLLLAGTASFPCLEYALLSPLLAMTFCHRKKCEIRYSNERSASTNSKEEFKTAWLYLYVHLYLDKFIGEKGNVELSEWSKLDFGWIGVRAKSLPGKWGDSLIMLDYGGGSEEGEAGEGSKSTQTHLTSQYFMARLTNAGISEIQERRLSVGTFCDQCVLINTLPGSIVSLKRGDLKYFLSARHPSCFKGWILFLLSFYIFLSIASLFSFFFDQTDVINKGMWTAWRKPDISFVIHVCRISCSRQEGEFRWSGYSRSESHRGFTL